MVYGLKNPQEAVGASRQLQKHIRQLWEIGRPQPRHRIPSLHSTIPFRPTSRITPLRNIVKRVRVLIDRRVDEAHGSFADQGALLVD